MLISQQLSSIAQTNAIRPAVRYLGKEITYNEFKTVVSRLSYLYQIEIGAGSRVAFLARNSPAVIASFFALSNIRAVTIFIDPDLPPEQIVPWLKGAKATHLAVTSDLVNQARDILQAEHLSIPIFEIEKKHGGEYDTTFSPPPDNRPVDTDIIIQFRTAGTLEKPKFASFTHKQLLNAVTCVRRPYHSTANDRFLSVMSWAHPFSFIHSMLYPLFTGGTCVIDHGLRAVEFLQFLIESRVTRLVGTPPFFLKLLMTCRNEKLFLPGTKSVTVGLGSISEDLRRAFALLKISVAQVYGQTENVWTIAMEDTEKPLDSTDHACMGLPGIKYKVLDPQGDEIEGKGERSGLLAVMASTVMTGYMDLDKETKSALRGSWLYTGDYAKLEGDGETLKLTYLGRKEDLLEANGTFSLPTKLDKTLKGMAGIKDAAAFVIKTHKTPLIAVAVVKAPGLHMTEKQVLEFCVGHMEASLVPKAVAFTDVIPRDSGGNVNYHKLRAQFSGMVS